MRIGVPVWNDRIAPVFDTADSWLLFEAGPEEAITSRRVFTFISRNPADKVAELIRHQIDLLICGAIPACYSQLLEASGCRVEAFKRGNPEAVLQAYLGNWLDESFSMPGCRGRGRRCTHRGWRRPH